MAEMAKMTSQLWTSYSTSYTLWGLTRRYVDVLRGDLTTRPIISGVELKNFAPLQPAYRTRRRIQGRVTIFWVHPAMICFQLSVAEVALNNMRYKQSLHLIKVVRQMAPLLAKNRIFATFSPPVQKVGAAGTRYPYPVI